mmetsp:Transcript_118274/g.335445  ORF Transcript_118274/g.335445 Transcript_118274/m.335445 type:complete len:200 (-) Transcript_118274:7-606(-)
MTGHSPPPACSAARSSSWRRRLPLEGIAFGAVLALSQSGGARGVLWGATSSPRSGQRRRRWPTSWTARDFRVAFTTSGPLLLVALASEAADLESCGVRGPGVSWEDISASRSGNRTGGMGGCQSRSAPEPGSDSIRLRLSFCWYMASPSSRQTPQGPSLGAARSRRSFTTDPSTRRFAIRAASRHGCRHAAPAVPGHAA